MRDLAGDLFAFDARVWRTFGPLLHRPGFLTVEYFAGRRVRYVPPLRLYVFIGFAFFGVMAVTGGGPLRFVTRMDGESVPIGSEGDSMRDESEERTPGSSIDPVDQEVSGERDERSLLENSFEEKAHRAAGDLEGFNAAIIGTLSYVHFLLVPIFAALLKLFWRRHYYIEHLVFGLHFHAFVLLPGIAIVALYAVAGNPDPESSAAKGSLGIWLLIIAPYSFLALRRVHGDRLPKLALKFIALGFLYPLVASVVVGLLAVAITVQTF